MRASLTKVVAVLLTALILGVGALGASTPASAAPWHGGWHGGGWRGGYGWGWGPGLALGGLALGAAIASAPYYHPYYGYNNCLSYQPVYDRWGHYIGRQPVNMCR